MVAPGSSESARREGVHPAGSSEQVEGRIVGARYRILGQIGSGGMGAVYLCEHVELGRRHAIKILHAGRALDPELVGRFRQEAQAASRIDQENVVQVVDFGEDASGDLYYVMELLEGRTLAQLMREEGPVAVPRALALLEQVCRALMAAHAQGVVHRDVKPDNVLVARLPDGTERAKLIDFGISHLPATGRLTRAGEIIGTPEYMAPEQASGVEVDEQTDVYAVGVLAFELLTGTLPLLGATPIATLVAHQTQPPPAPSSRREGLTPELDALVLRALAKEKGERFQTMQALAAEVMRVRVAASLASVARRTGGGEWSNDTVGTGRGGTIGLAAVPYAEQPLGPAPILPALGPEAAPRPVPRPTPPPPPARVRRRAWAVALAVLTVAVLVVASLVAHQAGILTSTTAATPTLTSPPTPTPTSTPTSTSTPEPAPPLAAPKRLEDDQPAGPPAPRKAAPRPPAQEPLRDPYATPADPLKPDPFR